jgi:hypothetical protein
LKLQLYIAQILKLLLMKNYIATLLILTPFLLLSQERQKIGAHFCIVHPIVTFSDGAQAWNFDGSYTVGFPIGISVPKSEHITFSFELIPFLKVANGESKINNFLFHPGIAYKYKNGFALVSRLAFETGGRYGFTEIFNKNLVKKDNYNLFCAIPVPVRFGSGKPASVGLAVQFGIGW